MNDFAATRRQRFIGASYAKAYGAALEESVKLWSTTLPADGDSLEERQALAAADVAESRFKLLVLGYTAGHPIESLREELSHVVAAHVAYQKALAAFEDEPQIAPLGLERLGDYERCVQLIGLCYLLHRRDLLPVIARIEDPGYAGHDALYEELLDYELAGRFNTDKLYHAMPYALLVQAMFRATDEESLADLKAYCKAWYPAMRDTPWHDGHLSMTDTDGYYFGYWAFEAGAVAYLLELDDSSIDHLVYPKDLVNFARGFDGNTQPAASSDHLRVVAGEPCPRAGYWFTPAKLDSRRHFKLGEVMPDTKSDYGTTIWQWDDRQ